MLVKKRSEPWHGTGAVQGRHKHRMGGIGRKDRKQEINHMGREQARGIRDALLKRSARRSPSTTRTCR